jgi:predicted peptidase
VRREGLAELADEGKGFDFILVSPQCPAAAQWIPQYIVAITESICDRFAVDPDRVYLTGYSMGGFGTWQTAGYDPHRFAAIAPLAGGGDVGQANRLKDLPIWAFHGEDDDTVPLETGRAMVEAVRKCGGRVKFTVYPQVGHGICDLTYNNEQFYEWLLAQRRSASLKYDITAATNTDADHSRIAGER